MVKYTLGDKATQIYCKHQFFLPTEIELDAEFKKEIYKVLKVNLNKNK